MKSALLSQYRAFSLTELLIAIACAGAALGIALPLYNNSLSHARQGTCDNQMSAIFQAEEVYRLRTRAWTTNLSDLTNTPGVVTRCPCATAMTPQYTLTVTSSGNLSVGDACGMHKTGKRRQTVDGVTFTEVNCQ